MVVNGTLFRFAQGGRSYGHKIQAKWVQKLTTEEYEEMSVDWGLSVIDQRPRSPQKKLMEWNGARSHHIGMLQGRPIGRLGGGGVVRFGLEERKGFVSRDLREEGKCLDSCAEPPHQCISPWVPGEIFRGFW